LEILREADLLIGHNIIKYDLPVLKLLRGWLPKPGAQVYDTLIAATLAWPGDRLKFADAKLVKRAQLPAKLLGRYSLESFGYRLRCLKGEYKGGWEAWNQDMQDYADQDGVVTEKLFEVLQKKEIPQVAFDLEQQVAAIISDQEVHGVYFDVRAAEKLYAVLSAERADLTGVLQETFLPRVIRGEEVVPVRGDKRLGYVKGAAFTRVKIKTFNPGSREQCVWHLKRLGWEPDTFTKAGAPKLDDAILSDLPYPEAKPLARYFLLSKLLGMLGDGDNAWLRSVTALGKIHGEVNTNAAVTGRATHREPNLAQVPKVKKNKDGSIALMAAGKYGFECRSLFIQPPMPGYTMVGADCSGLELRVFAHYLAPLDGGNYVRVVTEGDVHTTNQLAAGLPNRDNAKTFIYALIYGAGDAKLGSIVGKGKAAGAKLRKAFLEAIPGMKRLVELVAKKATQRGFLVGLDGRKLYVRKAHAALNLLFQSAGALICKQWMVEVRKAAAAAGLTAGEDFIQVLWVHDEIQVYVKDEHVDLFKRIAVDATAAAGDFFKIRCPLTGEAKAGSSWAETH
jgi:DNA polymerase I-like protein with 3'-5' exonuclease and polymerase domains